MEDFSNITVLHISLQNQNFLGRQIAVNYLEIWSLSAFDSADLKFILRKLFCKFNELIFPIEITKTPNNSQS